MSLPDTAIQIACGDNHTVVLLQSGEVWTFGKHQEGQLGRKKEEGDEDSWNSTPRPVPNLGDGFKATWIGARGNQTFIAMDESLVSENSIRNCSVFANSQTIGEMLAQNYLVMFVIFSSNHYMLWCIKLFLSLAESFSLSII